MSQKHGPVRDISDNQCLGALLESRTLYSSTSHFPQQILALVKNLSFLSTKISTNQSIPITSGNQSTIHYIPSNIPRYYHKFPAYCTTSCAPRHRFLTQQIPKVILLQRSAIKIQTLLLNMDFHAGRCKTACPVNFLLFFPSPRTISSSNSFREGAARKICKMWTSLYRSYVGYSFSDLFASLRIYCSAR